MKKVLLMCVSMLLVAALSIGGTLAYLTSTDSAVNVMTVGNVKIEQHEQERDETGNALRDFTQAKPALPSAAPADYIYWANNSYKFLADASGKSLSNVIDKIITVENVGKSDAYVRTIIAFEAPEGFELNPDNPEDNAGWKLMRNDITGAKEDGKLSNTDWRWEWIDSRIEIDGVKYAVAVVTHEAILEPKKTTIPSLLQYYITAGADNEDLEALGETVSILAVSQAVQAAGFDKAADALNAAFNDGSDVIPEAKIIEWFGGMKVPTVVSDAEDLVKALENGEDVVFDDDVKIDPAGMSNAYGTTGINVKNGQTIDGNGNTLDIKGAGGTWDSGINTTGGTIKNITVTGSFRGIFINHNSEHSEPVILENVVIDGTTYTISCDQGTNQTLTATDSTFNGWTSYAATLGSATFTDCKFGEGNGYAYCRPYAPTEFVGCEFEAGYEMDPRAAVTFENCTLGGVALTADNLATLVTSNIANASVK